MWSRSRYKAFSFALPQGAEWASVGRRIGGYFMELVVWARGQTPGEQVLGMYCSPSDGRSTVLRLRHRFPER